MVFSTKVSNLYWILIFGFINYVYSQDEPVEFTPTVTATCKSGVMNIKVMLPNAYYGAVHAKDNRTANCMVFGDGSNSVGLSLNLLAKQGQSDYCGILVSNVNGDRAGERSVQLAVRVHRTLELADDKLYVITCGKIGFPKDDNSQVILKVMENNRRVRETVRGREYTLTAEVKQPNGTYGIRVKNCFAFSKKNITMPLINDRGCTIEPNIISEFKTNSDGNQATAIIKSMFNFPEGSEVNLQCDIVQCNGGCSASDQCDSSVKGGRALAQTDDGMLLAATTVFALDPADVTRIGVCEETGVRPPWLLWLTIALGVLFLIMLLMNIFLCTAMSCSCARTEIIEKEPSIIEEYDPYRSWHGSQYGSRYSLHGRDAHKGYTSGGSTIHSNRSIPNDTDHYAIVHARPVSRHSGLQGYQSHGPSSNL